MRKVSQIALAIFSMMIISEVGFSESLHPDTYTFTDSVNKKVNPNGSLSSEKIYGTVSYDLLKRVAKINIERPNACPPGMYCILGYIPLMNIELPVVYDYTDSCGVQYVFAYRNEMPADGELTSVWIVNRHNDQCREANPSPLITMTEIHYYSAIYSQVTGSLEQSESEYRSVMRVHLPPQMPLPLPLPGPL